MIAQGADCLYGVPGESYLPVLDALHDAADRLPFITCRHEGGAAMMAEADGKLTARPGICLVTRGPGATNASAGIHIARQDSTPLILLVGQVSRAMQGREAFQEIDLPAMFGPITKWAAQIDEAAQVPEMMARAFSVAASGRPGPVMLAMPEDMLQARADVPDAAPCSVARAVPGARALRELRALLGTAERPLMILGGGGWDAETVERVRNFAERSGIPVAVSFRRQDYFDNAHSAYAGVLGLGVNPKLAQRVRDADLLLVLGARLGEVPTSGYTLLDVPTPRQKLVHVHADPDELGRVYQATLPINADPRAMAIALDGIDDLDSGRWSAWAAAANADYRAFSAPIGGPGQVQLGEVVAVLRELLPADAIVTNGAGNYTVWVHRFHCHRRFGTQLAPIAGSMGYGVPAAVAAKLRHPDRAVVAFAGDGCFLMTGQELATAIQYDAKIVCIVVNNGMLGTIRMHQERNYPGRVSSTDLVNPDFAAYARAFGGHGEIVERTEDFAAAFERARASSRPAVIELRLDAEALTPASSLSEIRSKALARPGA
ncbi:MAG TPA: thiamine pyrophosphate-binding protein [Gammaproteobacteria bacterium]|nr:thiamine pyrophosphate-binding protein [Gammaproteobacteria bacterium]